MQNYLGSDLGQSYLFQTEGVDRGKKLQKFGQGIMIIVS